MQLNSSYSRDSAVRKIADSYKNKGYEYHRNIFKNVLSHELFSNPTQDFFYRPIEAVIETLIDSVKNIKHHIMFVYDQNEIDKID